MKIKNIFRWYFLLKKRLLKKPVFVLLLLAIPILTFAFSFFAKTNDTGLLRIALAAEENDALTVQIMESVAGGNSLVRFTIEDSPEAAVESISKGENDGAWVFSAGLCEKLDKIALGEKATLVTAYEAEENIFHKIAKEKVFAAIYHEIAYRIYENAAGEELSGADIAPEELLSAYEKAALESDLVTFAFANAPTDIREVNYLTSPLRGLLCVVMLLCSLAATLYYMSDEEDGTFDLLASSGRTAVLYMTNFAALTLSCTVMTAALILTGDFTDIFSESLVMLLYIVAAAGFSSAVGAVFKKTKAFSLLLPLLTVLALVFSPVFFDISSIKGLQILLPSYHYLYAANGASLLPLVIYGVAASALAFLLNFVSSRIRKRR